MKISAAIERAEANRRKYGGGWHVLKDGPFLYITSTPPPGLNVEVIYSTHSPDPVKQSDNEVTP